jgi:hypothetical protein
MAMNPSKIDDLTIIPGIGPARQKWLRNTFHIHTYQDLAVLSAEQIQTRLKEAGQIASLAAIRAWLVKAEELAASVPGSPGDENESLEERLIPGIRSLVRENGWKPFASFVVEFQSHQGKASLENQRTAVHYMEADTGMTWPGIETSKLCQWMSNQVGASSGFQADEIINYHADLVEAPPSNISSAKLKVTRIRLYQPPGTLPPVYQAELGSLNEGFMGGNKPFQAEIEYMITGPGAADITHQQATCTLQAFAYELSSGKSTVLGEAVTIPLKDGVIDYVTLLQPVSLSPGKYRMWVTVGLQIPIAVPDFLEIPVLNII